MNNDKVLHLLAGLIISLAMSLAFGPWIGFACAFVAGIAKELYDRWDYGIFDVLDLSYTIAGGVLGSLIVGMMGGN